MAKKIKVVYDRVSDYLKKYQSGIDTVDNFNGKFLQSQAEFANYLFSIHATNEKASELLQCLIVTATATSSIAGFINRPSDFMYYLSGAYESKPIHKLSINEFDLFEQIPQRRGSIAKKRVNISGVNLKWKVSPSSVTSIDVNYVKQPPAATIVFTIQSTDDEDILVYNDGSTVDFVWPDECVPTFVFLMLEKYGVSIREDLLREYAQIGLSKEAAA